MTDIKFSKYGEGACQKCGINSKDIYIATLTSPESSKSYALCKDCAYRLNEAVTKKNAEDEKKIVYAAGKPETFCVICGNKIGSGEERCSVCGTLVQGRAAAPARKTSGPSVPQRNTGNAAYNGSDMIYGNAGNNFGQQYNQPMNPQPVNGGQVYVSDSETMKYSSMIDNPKKAAKYSKLGGYILLFCITQVISCLWQFFSGVITGGSITTVNIVFGILFGIFAGSTIWAVVKRNGVFIKIFGFGTILLLIAETIGAFFMIAGGLDAADVGTEFIRDMIYFAAWFEYFEKSERCMVYFGGREYLLQSIFTKGYYKKHYAQLNPQMNGNYGPNDNQYHF